MKTPRTWLWLSFFLLALTGPAMAGPGRQEARDRANRAGVAAVGLGSHVRNTSRVIDAYARHDAERFTRAATGGTATVTSRDRPRASRLGSSAHDRGAIDVVTPNMGRHATAISAAGGRHYTVIHERPQRTHDRHDVYANGAYVKSSNQPRRATGEHLHVQPEFNRQLHGAAGGRSSLGEQRTTTNPRAISNRSRPR